MKITHIELTKYAAYCCTLTNGNQTTVRSFGRKWFPSLWKAIANGLTEDEGKYVKPGSFKIKIGDDLPGEMANSGYFKVNNSQLSNFLTERSRKELENENSKINKA